MLSNSICISDNIESLIFKKYNEAKKNKSLHYVENETVVKSDPQNNMNYWIRFAPSLTLKPERGDILKDDDPLGKHEPELLVLKTLDKVKNVYKLILNKFPIVPYHSLLVTNSYKDQYELLTSYDLNLSIQIICQLNKSYTNECNKNNVRFMMIFNSGPFSGSSLNHKHLQLIKLPSNLVTFQDVLIKKNNVVSDREAFEPLKDETKQFAHFVLPIDNSKLDDPTYLFKCYMVLYNKITLFFSADQINKLKERSYNLLLTQHWICLVPRKQIKAKSLSIGFNSVGFAGLIFVKDKGHLIEIKKDYTILNRCLLECSFPQNHLQLEGGDD